MQPGDCASVPNKELPSLRYRRRLESKTKTISLFVPKPVHEPGATMCREPCQNPSLGSEARAIAGELRAVVN